VRAAELDPWNDRALTVVGSRSPRVEAVDKVRGRAIFTADVRRPRQAYGEFVRSPHPNADVVSIDSTAALSVDGVLAVFADGVCRRPDGSTSDAPFPPWYGEDAPFFAATARFAGDEVALVVATDRSTARAGAAAVTVVWSPRPHVIDPITALEGDAPAVHADRPGNLAEEPKEYVRGEVEPAIDSATHVVRRTFVTPTQVHNALESHGAVAERDGDGVVVWASTQGVNDVREAVADALDLPHNQVRVIAEHVGGGFGAKQVPWKPTIAAVVAARHLDRPVMVMNDRRAENLAAGKRNATVQTVTLAADDDGRLLAIDADIVTDHGAYSTSGEGSAVDGSYQYLYQCAAVRTRIRRAHTNTGPAVAFRAPGYVEAAFALESAMDELAEVIGIDPIALRRRNLALGDQLKGLPWSSPDAVPTALDRLARTQASNAVPGLLCGRGIAVCDWLAATAMPPGTAWAEFNSDGSVHIATSAQDIGTGTRTMLSMVAAEELGVPTAKIRVSLGDTAGGPPAPTSAGSTTTPTMAPAVRAAAAELRAKLLGHAAQHLRIPADRLTIDDADIVADSGERLAVAELLEAIDPTTLRSSGELVERPSDVSPRAQAAALADVTVDPLTGEVRVRRLVIAPDCGRIIDRQLVDSQVIGGATQGIGFALCEQQPFDRALGLRPDAGLESYLVPTIGDIPEIVHEALDIPDLAANALGVKGIGELPMIPVPAAIANAVARATGRRFDALPLDRAAMLAGLEPSSTEPSSTEPSSTEPSSTEPSSTEPSSTEPSSTEPSSTEPSSTGTENDHG
jgi:CO/xanthine dehydrogenase Mo-binding subunit